MLSQFTKEIPEHLTLADLYSFPKDVYAIGRLDKDSEGLLLLSNDKKLNHQLLNPKHQHRRTYWAQVEGEVSVQALNQLRSGVEIRINKKAYQTLPAKAKVISPPTNLWERTPPIRFRANIPTTWLELELKEGKNRQVRRMCAKVGLPVLRLIRCKIEDLDLGGLAPGSVKKMEQKKLFKLLRL